MESERLSLNTDNQQTLTLMLVMVCQDQNNFSIH